MTKECLLKRFSQITKNYVEADVKAEDYYKEFLKAEDENEKDYWELNYEFWAKMRNRFNYARYRLIEKFSRSQN